MSNHSRSLSIILVEVIIFQSKSLFSNAFKMNPSRMCEVEMPVYYSYLHNVTFHHFIYFFHGQIYLTDMGL